MLPALFYFIFGLYEITYWCNIISARLTVCDYICKAATKLNFVKQEQI